MKKIIAIATVVIVALFLYITWAEMQVKKTLIESLKVEITEKDRKKAEEIISNADKMVVYLERMGTDTVLVASPGEKIGEVTGAIIKRAKHKDDIVLWKGAYPSKITLGNGKNVNASVSCYGCFFAVDGINGYFEIQESDWEEWDKAIGVEELELLMIEPEGTPENK